jgi:hypothetical protein
MSILIQTAPGELAHLEAELQLAITETATSITGRILGQSIFFLRPRPAGVPPASIATKTKSTESIAAALEQSALYLFLAANVPATTKVVS